MKPSPELLTAARKAFYDNCGDDAADPFELMFEALQRAGFIRLIALPRSPTSGDALAYLLGGPVLLDHDADLLQQPRPSGHQ